jgi:adenylate kinase
MARRGLKFAGVVLLGPPASGKGTQGRLLAERGELCYFSTGQELRREVERGTEFGMRTARYLSQNRYVPDEMALELAMSWLADAGSGWVIDGFPRTRTQALELDDSLGDVAHRLRTVFLDVPLDEILRRAAGRWECGRCPWVGPSDELGACPCCGGALVRRGDDDPPSVRKRVAVYEDLTLPVVEFYAESSRLVHVSGVGSAEEVFKRVLIGLEYDDEIHG